MQFFCEHPPYDIHMLWERNVILCCPNMQYNHWMIEIQLFCITGVPMFFITFKYNDNFDKLLKWVFQLLIIMLFRFNAIKWINYFFVKICFIEWNVNASLYDPNTQPYWILVHVHTSSVWICNACHNVSTLASFVWWKFFHYWAYMYTYKMAHRHSK